MRVGAGMKATKWEYRFRFLLHGLIYATGLIAPWDLLAGSNRSWDTIRTWQFVAAYLNRGGLLGFSAATIAVLVAGVVLTTLGALVRTWGAAYLGAGVVHHGGMVSSTVVAAGPYRFVRNPLYLGTVLHTLGLCLLMPPTGAVFAVVATVVLQLRLIGAEEPFLRHELGESYATYCARVPRLLPALWPKMGMLWPKIAETAAVKAHWFTGVVCELYFWGTALSFAWLGWRYNAQLVLQGVIVSLGISIVARAFLPKRQEIVAEG